MLASEYQFEALSRDATFTSVADVSQGLLTSILGQDAATGFNYIVPGTFWDQSLRRPVYGAVNDQNWQMLLAFIPGGPLYQFRLREGQMLINPTMEAGHEMALTWQSSNWVLSADGTTVQGSFSNDNDTTIYRDDTIKMGLRAAWLREKGLPYADLWSAFIAAAEAQAQRSKVSATLYLDRPSQSLVPGIWVPAGNLPLTGGGGF